MPLTYSVTRLNEQESREFKSGLGRYVSFIKGDTWVQYQPVAREAEDIVQ